MRFSVKAPRSADKSVKLGILEKNWARVQVKAQKLEQVNFSIAILVEKWH